MIYTVHEADVLEALRAMPDNSYHGALSDPPYGLTKDGGKTGFMGHTWDKGVPPAEVWREVLRVLKPGAHLLAFGGTRTFHRLTCAIEDAGFEIRDSIAEFYDQDAATQAFLAGLSPAQRKDFDRAFVGAPVEAYLYGSGFPKSHCISKAIDREAGAVRPIVGPNPLAKRQTPKRGTTALGDFAGVGDVTSAASAASAAWSGHGSALKPAFEPVIVARKPLTGTLAANCQEHGCGGLAIDACRIEGDSGSVERREAAARSGKAGRQTAGAVEDGRLRCNRDAAAALTEYTRARPGEALGRWPANVIFSHHPNCVEAGTREVVSRGGNGGVNLGETRKSYSGGYKVQGEATGVGTTKTGTKYMRQETVAAYECVGGCPVKALDGQTGTLKSHDGADRGGLRATDRSVQATSILRGSPKTLPPGRGDSGGASRFFKTCAFAEGEASRFMYTAKASQSERNAGLSEPNVNVHPCLKPLALTKYLARLILPPVEGSRLLVPFCGSGSEMVGALQAGWSHVEGIDSWDVAVKIARARLAHHEALLAKAAEEQGQLSLVGT